jgi:type I restriction enzyme S subunit
VNSLSHLGKSLFVRNIGDVTVFESNMMRFRVDESRVLGVFLAQYLLCERVKAHVRGRAKRAVAQSSINQGDVRSIPVPLPSVREQEQIVTILGACVQKLMAVQREIELLDELFSVLLIELMNGGRSVSYLASQGIPR